jgi:hypothetical protein
MGNFIGMLLYVTGYTYDYRENRYEPPLAVRSAANNTYLTREVSATKQSLLSRFPGFAYNILIVVIMLWRVAYSIYMSIRDKDGLHFGRMIFQILFVIQYILGIIYFRKQHFYKNITSKSSMINLFRIFMPFTIVVALALSISMTVVMATGSNIHGYSEIFDSSGIVAQVLLSILMFIDSFYSYLTFSINACVFTINMLYQKKMVSDYADNLNKYIKSAEDEDSKLQTIAYDYFLTKDGWDETVGVLNYFFVFLNFGGFLAIYFYLQVISRGDISADEVANFILFILIDIVYIVSINNVYRDIGRVADSIGSTPMSAQYFTDEKDDNHTLNNMTGRLQRLDVEMGVLQNVVNNAPQHSVMIRTGESASLTETTDETHSDNDGATYNFDDFDHHTDHPDEVYMTDPSVSTSLRKVLTTVNGVQNMVNWMSLQGVAAGQWKTFRLFGVQLTDTTLISRLFGLLVALGIGSELISVLNWY